MVNCPIVNTFAAKINTMVKIRKESLAIDYDTRWKVLIEKHPRAFIRRFFTDIYPLVDFTFKPRFLKQEIHKLVARKKKRGGMKPDLVLEVRLIGGERRFLYIHTEVQYGAVKDFGMKMFRPFYWILDTYGVEIAAIAIFLGARLPKNHDHFEYAFGKTNLRYNYPVVVIKDLVEEELKQSGDMFDLALLACKYVLRTQGEKKAFSRYELTKYLMSFILDNPLGHSLEDDERNSIVIFVLNLLILPPELELRLNTELTDKYLKEEAMQHVYTHRDINFTDALTLGIYGEPASKVFKIWKRTKAGLKKAEAKILAIEAEIQKAEAKIQDVEAEKQKAEAEKQKAEVEKQKAEAEKIQTIYKLSLELALPAERIASLMNLELTFVQAVLDKKPANLKN